MECSRIRLMLDEYIAGRLDPEDSSCVSAHISVCRSCADEMVLLKELNDIIKVEPCVYPSSDFTFKITDMVRNDNGRNTGFILRKFPLINLGVSLVLTGLLTMFISTPSINQVLNRSVRDIANGAASININLNSKTDQLGGYFKNIMNPGGIRK